VSKLKEIGLTSTDWDIVDVERQPPKLAWQLLEGKLQWDAGKEEQNPRVLSPH